MLRGRPPFRYFPPRIRAGRRCRCLKACCGIKWGLGWFRHTKGRLLHFESDTLRVGPPLQLAMVLRGLSFRLEAGKLQIGTLRADDSHTFKPRCVPGDFLSWFVPTNAFIPILTCKINIEGDAPVYTLKISPLSCQLGSWSRVQSNISQSQQVRSISLGLSQLTKFRAYGIQKEFPIQQKKSWMWLIHNAQPAALSVWALSFCKVRIERSGLLRSWSRALSENMIPTRKERLSFCWKFVACFRGVRALAFKAACGPLIK